jgi:hypothetical protein
MKKELARLDRNQLTGLTWGLVSIIKNRIEEDKIGETALDFAEWMCKSSKEKDMMVAFCKALVSGSGTSQQDHLRSAAISNPKLAQLLSKNSTKKRFLDRIAQRPDIQNLISKTAWGEDIDTK